MSEPSFSQRMGYKPVRDQLQIESMDIDLKNSLWNALYEWNLANPTGGSRRAQDHSRLTNSIWRDYFKIPVDSKPPGRQANALIKKYFFECAWYEVYDLVEFVGRTGIYRVDFISVCNPILEKEGSGYRFVGEQITPITSEEEIAEIEQAIGLSGPLRPVSTHLQTALAHMSNRENPDYRNSIKESISAVETLCRVIANKPKATLSDALKAIGADSSVEIHSALSEAFNKLYGWTSDDQGIRHSMLEESDLDFEDAKFMLVSCSGFTNYLIAKADKAGIELN